MLDIIIKNGSYPDFEAGIMVKGSLAIKDGKIKKIYGENDPIDEAKEIIDAEGKVVSPGFIDIHMHEEDFINEGKQYVISKLMAYQGVTTCVGGQCGVQKQPISYFKEVIEELGGAPVNYLMLVGYNEIRTKQGIGRHEQPTEEQLKTMIKIIEEELDAGAVGISFGIEYDPGITTDEVVSVVNAFKDREIFVAAHYRSDGKQAVPAVEEMIEIQRNINQKFQISHLSSCSAMGKMKECLKLINDEMDRNPNLDYDTYPYNAFSTTMGSEVFEDGCLEEWGKDYNDILLTDDPYKNVRCTKEIFDKCRKEHPEMLAVAFVMNEDEIEMAISNKNGMVASDGIINHNNGHPRAAGTFPRVLGKYVREEQALTLIDALEKMTLRPANRIGLESKGRIKEGCDADLVIFDPNTILDGATYESLNIRPKGINYVILGGEVAIKDNDILKSNLGTFITL